MKQSNGQIIKNFITAWSRLDADELSGFFTETGTYYNIPAQPVSGRDNIRAFIAGFIKDWSSTDWEIVNLVENENIVVAERVDRTSSGDKSVELPCIGIFEMENGKIREWRDYFDMSTYIKALS